MRVGVIGMGKLGASVAFALQAAGHDVRGWDTDAERRSQIRSRALPEAAYEPHLADLTRLPMTLLSVPEMVSVHDPEILLVTVQTPHDPDFEGVTPLTREPCDFDYSYLRAAVSEIAATGTDALVVIVSTCLPGTFDREIRPIAGSLRMAYHPLFIAMGSVIEDFRNPEFILVGRDVGHEADELVQMYDAVYRQCWRELSELAMISYPALAPFRYMSITSAELTKVAYNAAIGYKLALANGIGELADRVGADADDVMGTLKLADKRIVSTAYMTSGMGDGGGCHPRDQIALSWLADEVNLSHNPFRLITDARGAHAEWLAMEWLEACGHHATRGANLWPVMLGEAYKPNSPLTTGSHARLVRHYMDRLVSERFRWGDAVSVITVDRPGQAVGWPLSEDPDNYSVACYFLACPHDGFLDAPIPAGSVVVDPWGAFPEREGVEVVRLGRRA